ncbi:MAG: ATP-binding cassette domain-containing protein [Methanospirillaceae archaeon]|nr:ATP-binding cassette domain-containing protein [Methanospirillaceae archaeon]
MTSIILEAREITYSYPYGPPVICGISFHIRKGEKIALVGPNGAGKSTLLLMCNGMIKPDSGMILYDNKPIQYNRSFLRELRTKIGFVFQNPDNQIIAPTVYQDVAFGPVNLGLPQNEVITAVSDALRAVGLDGFERRPPHQLSGGEKKRVAMAGILAMNPEVLVFDEPTSMLDPQGSEDMMELLEEMHNKGKTIIISTHDVELAYPWADRVILMEEGNILDEDIPELAFADKNLIRKAHLSVPILLELYMELVKRGMKEVKHPPRSVLDMIRMIESDRHGQMQMHCEACGVIHIADCDAVPAGKFLSYLSIHTISAIGAMGNRAKTRLKEESLYPDFTYAVIDRCILQAMNGKNSLLLTSGGMLTSAHERIISFNNENNRHIRIISVPTENGAG